MFVITGATGNIGRHLVDHLLAEGASVRATSRDPERAGLPPAAEVLRADLSDQRSVEALCDGAEGLFLNLAALNLSDAEALVRTAARTGLRRIVFNSSLTVTDTPADEKSLIAHAHSTTERALRASGVEWTFLRGGMYAANSLMWVGQIRATGVVRGAYADSTTAPVHEADLAEVACQALLDPKGEHVNQVYGVTGPEALTTAERVAVIARVLDRDIRFEEVPAEAAIAGMTRNGVPEELARDMTGYAAAMVGTQPEITDTVQRVTGHPARSYEQWVREHVDAFR